MRPMRHLRIKNWKLFQQYPSDKSAAWIKLYNWLLADADFRALRDGAKLTLVMIWLLASTVIVEKGRPEGEDEPWIPEPWLNPHDLGMQTKPRIPDLVDAGFVYWDSRIPSVPFLRRQPKKSRNIPSRDSKNSESSSVSQEGGAGGDSPIVAALERFAPGFVLDEFDVVRATQLFGAEWVASLVSQPDVYRHLTPEKGGAYLFAILASRHKAGWQPRPVAVAAYIEPVVRRGVTADDIRDIEDALRTGWADRWQPWLVEIDTTEGEARSYDAHIRSTYHDSLHEAPTLPEWVAAMRGVRETA